MGPEKKGIESGRQKQSASGRRGSLRRLQSNRDPFLRAAHEDDDGYDPYSDRPADNPFYEEDPWR